MAMICGRASSQVQRRLLTLLGLLQSGPPCHLPSLTSTSVKFITSAACGLRTLPSVQAFRASADQQPLLGPGSLALPWSCREMRRTVTVSAAGSQGGGVIGDGMELVGSEGSGVTSKKLNHKINDCRKREILDSLLEDFGPSFNYIHASTAMAAARKVIPVPVEPGTPAATTFAKLVKLAQKLVPVMGSRALANCLLTVATLKVEDEKFLTALCGRGQSIISEFSEKDLVRTIGAMENLQYSDPGFMAAMLDAKSKMPPSVKAA